MLSAMKTLQVALAFAASLFAVHVLSAQAASAVYPAQSGYVDAHGVLIYYVEFGHSSFDRGRSVPLVILHGGPGADHTYFLPYLLPLARTHRLIFIDERGSGQSERLQDASQYTIEKMADDVEAVRVALGLGKIDLLGHSCGGVLAEAYALKYQKNLNHLILNSTFASTREMNEVLAREKAAMPADKLARLNELEQAGLYDKGAPWEHGRYPAEYETLAWGWGYFPFLYGARPDANYDPAAGNAPTNWELYREMWGSDGEFIIDGNLKSVEWVDRLPTIHVPTLIVVGDHDECDPSLSKEMHEKIAGSRLVILPNSGHMNFIDQPELWQKAVSGFLSASPAT
jgi:proline iminopeptidase